MKRRRSPPPAMKHARNAPRAMMRRRTTFFTIAGIVAVLVFVLTPSSLGTIARLVAGYDAGALTMLVLYWTLAIHNDASETAERAALEDPGRNVVLAVVVSAVIAGLISAVAILGKGPHAASAAGKAVSYALAIGAVAFGWLLVHTAFIFRYAHSYYFDVDDDNEADRGLTFPGTTEPSDFDFAYFSFVIGMTYQVSDVQITDRKLRRLVLYHALISFAYSTMILALAINIVSGLLH